MKKIIACALLLSISAATFCQQVTVQPNQYTKADYFKKAHNQKKAAWIMAGTGVACVIVGGIMSSTVSISYLGTESLFDERTSSTGKVFGVIGLCSIAGSIPLFISAGKNKHKAILAVRDQPAPAGLPIAVSKKITGLTISIPIGN